jgi:hypothetical protein
VLTTPGVGRADVWVFDSADLGDSLGGHPLGIVTLFSDTPRALAATPTAFSTGTSSRVERLTAGRRARDSTVTRAASRDDTNGHEEKG